MTANDKDGYHRVACPAVASKVCCPLLHPPMTLDYTRAEVLTPLSHPPTCCTQATITVPPAVNAKTVQRHDYPEKFYRPSYARRSAAERANARIKDRATIDIARGWCRLMGLTPTTLLLTAPSSCATLQSPTRSTNAKPTTHAVSQRDSLHGPAGRAAAES